MHTLQVWGKWSKGFFIYFDGIFLHFQLSFTILVIVNNLNDNPPVFERTTYNLNVDEVSDYFLFTFVVRLLFLNDRFAYLKKKTFLFPHFLSNLFIYLSIEMIPVGNSVGRFAATDLDQPSQLFYNLKSESVRAFFFPLYLHILHITFWCNQKMK